MSKQTDTTQEKWTIGVCPECNCIEAVPAEHDPDYHCNHHPGNRKQGPIMDVVEVVLVSRVSDLERERDSLRLELDCSEVNRKRDNKYLIRERNTLKQRCEELEEALRTVLPFLSNSQAVVARTALNPQGEK